MPVEFCINKLFVNTFITFCYPVNLGGLLLQALLEFWPRTHINPMEEEEGEVNHGKSRQKPLYCRPDGLFVGNSVGLLCSCSKRGAGEPASERQRLFPGASTHSGHLQRGRWKDAV